MPTDPLPPPPPTQTNDEKDKRSNALPFFAFVFSALCLIGVVILLLSIPSKNLVKYGTDQTNETRLLVSKIAEQMATETHVAKAAQAVIQKIDHWGSVSSGKLDALDNRPLGPSLEEIKKLVSERPGLTVDEVRTAVSEELAAANAQQAVAERQRVTEAKAKADAEAARASAEAAARAAQQQQAMPTTPAPPPVQIAVPTPPPVAVYGPVTTGPVTATGGQKGGPAVSRENWRRHTVTAGIESNEFDARKADTNGIRLEMKGRTTLTQYIPSRWGGDRVHQSEVPPTGYLVFTDSRKVTFRSEADLVIWERM